MNHSFQSRPTVIKNLLIINVLVFLAQTTVTNTIGLRMEDLFGLHHLRSPLFEPWQIITHLFLHGSFLHLFSNMFALWMFGSQLEYIWGPKRFFTFYFLCGIGAALIQLLWLWFQWHDLVHQFFAIKLQPNTNNLSNFYNQFGLSGYEPAKAALQNYLADSTDISSKSEVIGYVTAITNKILDEATIGASGAIFGVLAAYIYLFPNQKLYLYFILGVPAKWIGLVYFGWEIFSAFENNPTDNIAHWAHIGGGLVGFLLVLTWNRSNRRHFY